VIEDAAEALGSQYKGRRAGTFGKASVFSFHRTKTLSTGEGGMMLTDDTSLYERCRFLRDHGRQPGTYFNTEVAFKYMPFNVQAALGYGQLLRIDELIAKKRNIFNTYKKLLPSDGTIRLNLENDIVLNGAWATTVIFSRETGMTTDKVMLEMANRGIPTRPFFYPLSSLPAYRSNQSGGEKRHPVSYDLAGRGIHLPCALNLSGQQLAYISEQLSAILRGK
jgi:perosamine synthetase